MYKIPANTLFMGQQLVFVPDCHSTNNEVQQLIQRNGATDGVVIVTDNQTQGRGQRDTVWESEPGKNLTFSIGLRPNFVAVKDQFFLSMVVTLGVFDYLSSNIDQGDVHIKWPNDILVNGKKMCGMLIENNISQNQIQHAVVGIGLNVNQRSFKFPLATSMSLIEKKEFDLQELLIALLSSIEKRYLQLRQGELPVIKANYLEALFGRGEEQEFIIEGSRVKGILSGVESSGKLEVLVNGELNSFGFKEIEFCL